ncbi:hypothetical protein BO70DRAFT_375078 [Aspergillus heteromorphus CBS 117.55]|uniref:Ubiquitin fusion degradation protein n=1 Tax=Aspergillus heteromorphus CBS 117.55 TaxID=1448321 RepID=A0A317UW54_9EURO|nr:uncharacterized protein BO70DRAFT_375078 [Aspergillus heteromorphus CBS 117.55]PWY64737.1 hypothetical protein BO70DRAFT_375078 [Aspergillus heteromorphus CBS 117.55]
MTEGELCAKAMPATELAKARAALHEIQPNAAPIFTRRDELALGAVTACRQNLNHRAPDFFYGASRLTPKELGLIPAVGEAHAKDHNNDATKTPNKQPQSALPAPPRCTSLVDVLSNTLVLDQMAPYLSTSSLFALASTSRLVRSLIMDTPYVFRHLDLTECRGAIISSVSAIDSTEQINDSRTEDEYYSAPLRGIFDRLEGKSLLQDVRTLVLDGLPVPADLVADLILAERFNINILSIRECCHLNERKLMQVLNYAVRPSRPKGTPRIKGIYYFTPLQHSQVMVRSNYRDWWSLRCSGQPFCDTPTSGNKSVLRDSTESDTHRQNAWYRPSGQLFRGSIEDDWAQTIHKCEGIIAFDAILCRGPRHNVDPYTPHSQNQDGTQPESRLLGPRLTTVALGPRGCELCHTAPEGPAIWGQSPEEQFPLLTPPPFHTSSVVTAKRPALFPGEQPALIARCRECLIDRWCHRCNRWFCAVCLPHPERVRSDLSPHQTACGLCKVECQRTCRNCCGDYCVEHNEGCSPTMITLPPSALEQLLAAAPLQEATTSRGPARQHTGAFDPFNPHTFAAETQAREQSVDRQQQLPHPLTFRIVNPQNNRVIYAGVREFSASENEIGLSVFLRRALGVADTEPLSQPSPATQELGSVVVDPEIAPSAGPATVTVHAQQLPKGTYVRLRPLEAGYDPEDWKALLEQQLRDHYVTLTTGEILHVSGTRDQSFRFLVDKVEPHGDGICVVDTDLEVDIVALTDDQAKETIQKRLERTSRVSGISEGTSTGGEVEFGRVVTGQVVPGDYVDYELHKWDRTNALEICAESDQSGDFYLFVSPLSARQRNRPREDEHVFGDLSSRSSKRIRIRPVSDDLERAEALYISVHACAPTEDSEADVSASHLSLLYNLQIHADLKSTDPESHSDSEMEHHDSGDVQCKNCHQWVPQRTLMLHENFCLRNNALCHLCQNVFQKRSIEWQNHWHCPHDPAHGNNSASKHRHNLLFHTKRSCSACGFEAENLPRKPILCQFCHLVVPQQSETDPDMNDPEVLISGLTPHELVDGGRTTECHLCNKIIRLRDMKTHLRHHDLERLSRPTPRICLNQNCGRTLDGRGTQTAVNLGLCSICFGPLYVDTYDPEGKALRRRIERRYLSQMMTGCGKSWCQNESCKTGKQARGASTTGLGSTFAPVGTASILTTGDGPKNTAPFYLCADQVGQQRRTHAEMIAAEGKLDGGKSYALPWCVAAIEVMAGNPNKAREWLENWAPAIGEDAGTLR